MKIGTLQRFQVYKRRLNGGPLIHITSMLAANRIEAIKIDSDPKNTGRVGHGDYYISGITRFIGEDISSDFPVHIQRRIENKGAKVKYLGCLHPVEIKRRFS